MHGRPETNVCFVSPQPCKKATSASPYSTYLLCCHDFKKGFFYRGFPVITQEKIASFNTLLQENQLDPEEQQQALETIEECLRNLERDYLHAIDEHAAEQRRLRMATGGSIDPGTELDPGRVIESDIGRSGFQTSMLWIVDYIVVRQTLL